MKLYDLLFEGQVNFLSVVFVYDLYTENVDNSE